LVFWQIFCYARERSTKPSAIGARRREIDLQIQQQVFNLAGQVFGDDVEAIAQATCPSAAMRVRFAIYLAGRQKFAEAGARLVRHQESK